MIPYGRHWIDDDDRRAVQEVLEGDWLTTGPEVPGFEEDLCAVLGCRHAIAVSSGTAALDIAVQALDLPPGSEIITTPFTFAATANAILFHRHTPVFADIEEDTRNINPEDVRKRVTENTRAIIPVDFAGHPCPMQELREIAEEYGLSLIQDAAHALGASDHGRKVGSMADMTVFSFHPVKHITTGEGGAVVTDDPDLAEFLRRARNHGMDRGARERAAPGGGWAYDISFLGRNYRLTDIQSALGRSQLKKLDRFLARRREIAGIYNESLSGISEVQCPVTREGIEHAWHLYTILLRGPDRDSFFHRMRSLGIGVNVHYIPVYRFSYYRQRFGIDPRRYPVTEDVFSRIVSLPIHPGMTGDEVNRVIDAVRECVG